MRTSCFGLTATTLIVSMAHGQTAGTPTELFERGVALMKAGDFAAGCPLIQESYYREPKDTRLVALARCRDGEGKIATALDLYRAYLRAFERMTSQAQKSQADKEQFAQKRVSELKVLVPKLKLVWRGDVPKDVKVDVDGVDALGRLNTDWPLDPGEHRVVVERGTVADEPHVVTLESGKPVAEALDLTPPPLVVPSPEPKTLPVEKRIANPGQLEIKIPTTPPRPTWQRNWGIVAIGVGGAALAAGGVLGALALAEKNTVDQDCIGMGCTQIGLAADSRGRVFGNVATIPLLIGGGLMVTGIELVVGDAKTKAHIRTSLSFDRGAFLTVGGGF